MGLIFENQYLPLYDMLKEKHVSNTELFPSFYVPSMSLYFIGFFVVFDFAPNIYADMSGFADRQFYQDYWNCRNFDQWARKWNRLVHEYLYRHWYMEYLIRWRMTPFQANVVTFLFSIFFHEAFLTLIFKRVSFYLTSLQIY